MENLENKYLEYIRENVKQDDIKAHNALKEYYLYDISFEDFTKKIEESGDLMTYRTFVKKEKIKSII